MFQNAEGVVEERPNYSDNKIKKLSMFANVFELRNIAVYIISWFKYKKCCYHY